MPANLPQSIAEEETKEALSIHGFKEGVLVFVLIASSLMFVIKSPFPYQLNLFLVGLYFIISIVGFRYITKNFYKLVLFNKSYKNVSFFDSRMDYFLDVRDIKSNILVFNDNSLMAILTVKPIDGSLLEAEEMQLVVDVFNSVLKSISHTIHIFSHSVEPNLDTFFASNENKILQNHSRKMQDILKANQIKEKWLVDKMKETKARDRENYFAIVYRGRLQPALKGLNKKHILSPNRQQNSALAQKSIAEINFRELNSLITSAIQQLEKTRVRARQLNDDDLINFYPSYFMNTEGIGISNLSPIMWHEDD